MRTDVKVVSVMRFGLTCQVPYRIEITDNRLT